MAGNMDERVVSMQFNNKQFERNAKKSMKTIDDLKESLDFEESGKSLDTLEQKFKKFAKENVFGSMDESIAGVRKGLGLLGDSASGFIKQFMQITKITAMIQAAESAIRGLERTIKQFTIAPISKGFEKYTTKIGAIKTISNATQLAAEQVNSELERLNWFTDETSASFGNMVDNIGKFTSVGRGLGESITAMQGIATWGYQSGAGVNEINRAMYNLSQALGTGAVKLMDWKSIENAGMATKDFKEQAIAAAEAAGKLKRKGDKLFTTKGNKEVTYSNFNETLAQGWFTSDVLMSVLETYGGFATELKDYMDKHPQYGLASEAMEALDMERLEDRMNVFKDNLDAFAKGSGKDISKLKQEFAKLEELAGNEDTSFEDLEAAIADFSKTFGITMDEVVRINKITDTKERTKEIKKWADTVGVDVPTAIKILESLAKTEETIGEKAFKSSQQSKSLTDSIEATKDAVSTGWMNTFQKIFGGLDDSIELWTDVTEILWELFAAGAETRNNAFTHWAENFAGREDLWGEDGIMHSIMDTIIELKELLGSSFSNVFFPGLEKAMGLDWGDTDRVIGGLFTEDEIKNLKKGQYLGAQIKKVTAGLKDFGLTIRNFFTDKTNKENIEKIFTAIATVVKFVGGIIGGVFKTIGNFIKNSGILRDILGLAGKIASKVQTVFEKIQESGFVTKVLERIGNTLTWFYETIKKWVNQIGEFLEETGIADAIRGFFKRIETFFLGGEEDIDENGEKTESAFFRAFAWTKTVKEWVDKIDLKQILNSIKTFITNFGTIWRTFVQALNGNQVTKDQFRQGGVSEELSNILAGVSNFGTKLSGVFKFIKGIYDKIVGWLESSGILPKIREIWDGVKTFFGNLGLVWEVITTGKVGDPKKLDDKQKKLVVGIIKFVKKISNAFNKLKNWFVKAWDWLKDKWAKFVEWLESSGILPKIREIWNKIKTFLGNIGEMWSAFKVALSGGELDKKQLKNRGLSKNVQDMITKVWEIGSKIKGAWDRFTGWLESSGILPKLREWWGKITGWFEEVSTAIGEGSIFEKVGSFFTNLWTNVTGLFNGNGEETVEIPDYETPKGAEEAAEKTGNIFTTMLENVKSAFKNKDGKFDLTTGFTTAIAKIFEIFGSIDWSSISSNVFGAVVKVINGLDDACGDIHIDNILKLLTKIAGAFTGLIIAKTISDIATAIKSIKGKNKGILEQISETLTAFAQTILNIGIAVALIAASIWVMSTIKQEDLTKVIPIFIGLGVFFLALLALTAIFSNRKTLFSKNVASMASMFLYVGIAVALITASLVVLTLLVKKADPANVWSAIGIIVATLAVMVSIIAVVAKITKTAGAVNIAIGIATFAGMAILLAVMTACVLLLQSISWGNAIKGIVIVGAFMGEIVAAMTILSKVNRFNPKMMAGMIVMAVMLGLIVAAFLLLKDANPVTLGVIAGALAIIIPVMVASVKAMGAISPAALKGVATFAAALVIIIGALALGMSIASGAIKKVVDNIVQIMSSLAAASISAEMINFTAIKTALALLGEIAGAFTKAIAADATNALATARSAWTLMERLKDASTAAGMVEEKNFNKIFGSDGKSGLLKQIETGMSSVTDTGWKASTLLRNVQTLAENMKLVGQAGVTLAKNTGENNDGQTYIQGIQNVKERMTDINTIVQMAKDMATIGEDGTIDEGFLTRFSEGIGNIGSALQLYDKALAEFQKQVASESGEGEPEVPQLSTESINTALQTVMTSLKDIKFDDSQVSEIEKWAGLDKSKGEGGSQTLFALGLINIANAMDTFSNSATGFNNGNVDKAIESLGTLASIKAQFETNSPSEYKGMMDDVSTWGDGGSFATAISGMGTAIAAFGQSVKDIPNNSVKKATTALNTLGTLYEKLKGQGTVENYMFEIAGLFKVGGQLKEDKSADEVFEDFSLGIGRLGTALSTFSTAITQKEYNYDQDKVEAAVKILESMSAIQIALQTADLGNDWWYTTWFGENNLEKLGENMAGLGSRLTEFSGAVKDFDLDTNGDKWNNVKNVLEFLKDIWIAVGGMSTVAEEYSEEDGSVVSHIENTGYNLETLANGMNAIKDALIKFNEAMTAVRAVAGSDTETTRIGQWSSENFENVKSLITFMKDITIALSNADLKDNSFYDLSALGLDMQQMFNYLDDSSVVDFMAKLENFSSLTSTLKSLTDSTGEDFNTKGITFAGELISGFASRLISTDISDGKGSLTTAFATLIAEIGKHDGEFRTAGENTSKAYAAGFGRADRDGAYTVLDDILTSVVTEISSFNNDFKGAGQSAGRAFCEGFQDNDDGLFGTGLFKHSQTTNFFHEIVSSILADMGSQETIEQYRSKGLTSGKAYAEGFKSGLDEAGFGSLTPIVAMDSEGRTTTRTNLTTMLQSIGYATSTDISNVAGKLDLINGRFDKSINVSVDQSEVTKAIGKVESKLGTIDGHVDQLESMVNNLRVYIDSNILVGKIAPQMNRELGRLANISP